MRYSVLAAFLLIGINASVGGLADDQPGADDFRAGAVLRVWEGDRRVNRVVEAPANIVPNAARVIPTIDLTTENGGFGPPKDRFVTEIRGFLHVSRPGRYHFELTSDDGAILWIGLERVIDHDGLHGPTPKRAAVELLEYQTFRILHFDAGAEETLRLRWIPTPNMEATDDAFELVPAGVLFHHKDESLATSPGVKKIVKPLRRGLPGDGSPVAGLHPAFRKRPDRALDNPKAIEKLQASLMSAQLVDGLRRSFGHLKDKAFAHYGGLDQWHMRLAEHKAREPMPADSASAEPTPVRTMQGGPFDGDQLFRVYETDELLRLALDPVGDQHNFAAFRFIGGLDPRDSAIALPRGGLAIGRSNNNKSAYEPGMFSIAVLAPSGVDVFEMRSVRVMTNGLRIDFTQALDKRVGWDPADYHVELWPITKPHPMPIRSPESTLFVKGASVATDRRSVFLEIDGIQPSSIVYLRLLPPCLSETGELPYTTESWITVNAIPTDRPGFRRPPPLRAAQNVLTEQERDAGWKLLFDGQTTANWRGFRKDACPPAWQVVDNCLVLTGSAGDLITEEEYENFELKLDWRISAGGNSGIFFHVSEDQNAVYLTGPEMQVLDNRAHYDGKNTSTSAGANYALHAATRDVTRPVGFFNEVHLVVNGPHVEHWLNGEKIVEYELWSEDWKQRVAASKFSKMPEYGRPRSGHIALQDHGDRVWYRNIKIRRLP